MLALTLRSVANGYRFATLAWCHRMRVVRAAKLRLFSEKLPRPECGLTQFRSVDRLLEPTITQVTIPRRSANPLPAETFVLSATASDKRPRIGACLLTCWLMIVCTRGSCNLNDWALSNQ